MDGRGEHVVAWALAALQLLLAAGPVRLPGRAISLGGRVGLVALGGRASHLWVWLGSDTR